MDRYAAAKIADKMLETIRKGIQNKGEDILSLYRTSEHPHLKALLVSACQEQWN